MKVRNHLIKSPLIAGFFMLNHNHPPFLAQNKNQIDCYKIPQIVDSLCLILRPPVLLKQNINIEPIEVYLQCAY